MTLTKEQFDNLRKKGLTTEQIISFSNGYKPEKGVGGVGGVLVGAGKGALSTVKGLSSIGEKAITGIGRAVTPKKYEESLGFSKKEKTSSEELIPEKMTEAVGGAEKVGKFIEQTAEFAVPGTKVAKATKALPLVEKIGARALTSGGIATAQEGKIGKETGIATGAEIAFPIIGKAISPATKVVGRLFKGLGASLSGASSIELESIYKNAKTGIKTSKQIINGGQESVLRNNAKTILNGVASIKKEARSAYGRGLEVLSKKDINPGKLSEKLVSGLKKSGIELKLLPGRKGYGAVDFSKSEILDKGIRDKAKTIISEINDMVEPDGKKIKSMLDKIESVKFSKSIDPNRQSFNNLMNDLSSNLKKAVNESTKKLESINKSFSEDMDLANSVEAILGKVKFKNTAELNQIASRFQNLFNKKDLSPATIDRFFTRIGVNPEDIRTSEAVRNIALKSTGANTKGLSGNEIIQQITSAIVTPNAVKNIAIALGLAEPVVNSIIKNTSPSVRASIIKGIIESSK
jgi:hypothetical protein